jgi:hypothetical protein
MTENQILHLSMINSYNLIIGNASFDEIMDSDINFFAHNPTKTIESSTFQLIIWYFQDKEMFEYCAELNRVYNEMYNEDGSIKQTPCRCEYPEVKTYTPRVVCSICNNIIKRR